MRNRKLWLLTLLTLPVALMLAGCSGGDDPTDPANSGNIITLAPDEAEDFTTSALDMVNGLVDDIPEFASGDFAQYNLAKSNAVATDLGKTLDMEFVKIEDPASREAGKAQSDSIQWNAAQQAYTFAYEGPVFVLEEPNYWNMNLEIWLQYRNAAGDPLQYPVGAVEMEVDYVTGMAMHMEDEQSSATMAYDMSTNLTVAYLGGQEYGLAGQGHTQVMVEEASPQGNQSGVFDMDWTLDLVTATGGCPEGTVQVRAQGYTLNAVYDGQGAVNWTLTGPGYSGSGNEVLACGG